MPYLLYTFSLRLYLCRTVDSTCRLYCRLYLCRTVALDSTCVEDGHAPCCMHVIMYCTRPHRGLRMPRNPLQLATFAAVASGLSPRLQVCRYYARSLHGEHGSLHTRAQAIYSRSGFLRFTVARGPLCLTTHLAKIK